MKTNRHSAVIFQALLFLGLLFLDQISKLWAAVYLKDRPLPLIRNVFSLQYLENRGIGFGLFQGKIPLILVLNVLILILIFWILFRMPSDRRMMPVRLTLLFTAAGALGNILDRVRLGYVIDFFYFELIHFPIFNVADIYVTVSVILFAALYLWYLKPGELEEVVLRRDKKCRPGEKQRQTDQEED